MAVKDKKPFALGIDLGTTNSAMALALPNSSGVPEVVPIIQLASAGTVVDRPLLGSALYLPHEQEFEKDALQLPWSKNPEIQITGRFAREHGSLVPDRLVTSAKSWLCNSRIDRKMRVLPWRSESVEAARKVSPLEASCLYLKHLRSALETKLETLAPGCRPEGARVVLTVPASFDEAARSLTHEAAVEAGFGQVTLLEEPQAAFYAWLAQAGSDWRRQVKAGDLVLVCDVGGGTADFSLIAVAEEGGELALERISVGDHILLGGDNMDLALAWTLRSQLEAEGKSLDDWQFQSLVQTASLAKERLFSEPELAGVPISVPSRGSKLFAKTVSITLTRNVLEKAVVEGFMPWSELGEMPQQGRAGGLQELGLPWAEDAALSRHLGRFLVRSLENVRSSARLTEVAGNKVFTSPEGVGCLRPDVVLFNGGVFRAGILRKRVLEQLGRWLGGQELRELDGADLDLAVARGAACYARNVLSGKGIRIRAGTARSYYLGLESTGPAVPGIRRPVRGLCVVPQGLEEGSAVELPDREFGLVTGQRAEFRFFGSTVRAGDKPGVIVPDAEATLEETSRLEVELPAPKGETPGSVVPVRLQARVTELGTLELWMQHTASDHRWKLEFGVRTQ